MEVCASGRSKCMWHTCLLSLRRKLFSATRQGIRRVSCQHLETSNLCLSGFWFQGSKPNLPFSCWLKNSSAAHQGLPGPAICHRDVGRCFLHCGSVFLPFPKLLSFV